MMRYLIIVAALAISGCAMLPMSPEQAAHIRAMQLEQQRAYNAQMLESQRAMTSIGVNRPAPVPAYQAPAQIGPSAFWTGNSRPAQSVVGTPGLNCEFNYAGKTFWRMFAGFCPSSIPVQ